VEASEALSTLDPEDRGGSQLRLGFVSLGDHRRADVPGERRDRLDQRAFAGIGVYTGNERAVNARPGLGRSPGCPDQPMSEGFRRAMSFRGAARHSWCHHHY
jgi:hypothetical protein